MLVKDLNGIFLFGRSQNIEKGKKMFGGVEGLFLTFPGFLILDDFFVMAFQNVFLYVPIEFIGPGIAVPLVPFYQGQVMDDVAAAQDQDPFLSEGADPAS